MKKQFPYILALVFILSLIAFIFAIPTGSFAQSNSQRNPCVNTTSTNCVSVGSGPNSVPMPVTVSGGGGSGFVPSLSYTPLTATASSSASTALPTNTGTVAFQNTSSVDVSCTVASGAATATTNEIIVRAGSTIFVGTTGYDHAACINQTGSASNVIILAGGSGGGSGFGGGGSSGNGLVQTSPPNYTNGTGQPVTLNAQGALPAASLNLGAFTCSATCGSGANQTLLSVNTFGYTTFNFQTTASDGSLLEVDFSNDGGTTWSQLPLETYLSQGNTNGNGAFNAFIPTNGAGASACARIPNPGSLIRVFFTAWGNGTFTGNATLSNSNSCARPTIVAGGVIALSDLFGNSNIPPVVCGSAVSSCVLKNASGFLYGVYANCTSACWLMVFNAAAAPSNGGTTAGIASGNMQECIFIPAGGSNGINYLPGPPSTFANGITAVISSTSCGTLTLATTGFIHGVIR